MRKDGTTIPVEISLSPGKRGSGQEHVICTVRDIAGWKRMRRVSKMMVTAAENERKRLSRELHDGFLQSLVALKIRVKLLADETSKEDRERMRALVAGEIHETIRGVKRMIRELLPPALDHQGLSAALGSVFRDIRDMYGFEVNASLDRVDDEVDAAAALALYRIVQEAVTNAARHARVNEATVTLRSAGDVVIAEIRDEGCGFELEDSVAEPDRSHVGLVAMRERAALVGGNVTVRTSAGKGTAVRATVPIMGAEDEGDSARW
ncbi:PAS domain-containing sensor histidine kinase [Candidatus Palauibacter sp.]|uniref:sensor histidine kinase n=1 Tax=Candidatus Palauibacter sp. TaxID=3101350 RepID=UPI003C6F37E6